jgi:hypothetical protein
MVFSLPAIHNDDKSRDNIITNTDRFYASNDIDNNGNDVICMNKQPVINQL